MSFDGFVTRAVVKELRETLSNGRINKVYQPFETDLLLSIRANRKNVQLYISTSANFSRIHLTNERYPNPIQPPMFCMLVRKHIEGSIVKNIKQIELDRIIHIELQARDELGDLISKTLVVEIMGRHSNLILLDTERNIIIDSIKHLPPSLNSYRTVLPGREYVSPPSQNKANPLEADRETVLKKVDFNQGKIDQQLVTSFAGLSPIVSKEIVHRAGFVTKDSLPQTFLEAMKLFRNNTYEPEIVRSKHREAFSVMSLTHMDGGKIKFDTVSSMLDRFYFGKAERDRIKQQASDLEKRLSNEMKKNKRKLKKLEKTLHDTEKAEQYQLYGELLTAHMHEIKRGQSQVAVDNYYNPGEKVKITLDPVKTPAENAQAYYQKYTKAKNAVSIVKRQIEETKENIAYFELLLTQMEKATLEDVAEIREELEDEGIIKRKRRKEKKKVDKPKPETYESSEGVPILVGKNNKQNEYLTMKLARKSDTWLHAKDIPGSHVVIRGNQFGEETLYEAAVLAAYFSKAKQSSNVPIDYTEVRYVKKPRGAKPGFVTYSNQKTMYVTPSEDLVLKLRP
ncbi:NFACT family protein [Pueribacillus sp. YX66]|uniref:Rqc2 family fibronectin-binding protein n=1 Tax=Pueribacillus sp. YX66 TaxID=3229242 RepID=UPI00358D5B41